jgi:hypothetical protein
MTQNKMQHKIKGHAGWHPFSFRNNQKKMLQFNDPATWCISPWTNAVIFVEQPFFCDERPSRAIKRLE